LGFCFLLALSRIIISHDDDDEEDDKEEEIVSRRRKRRKARVNTRRRTHQSKEKEEEYVDSTGVTNYCLDWWQACVIIASAEKFEKDFDANALHLKGRTTT
tara:strand:+ start:76 stop:378 length:303 start_codon:yes stop_codon:yes gene_type:complete